jgi:hypothetical protein
MMIIISILDWTACTSFLELYTLAKEKLNMNISTLMKTAIASVLAVAVTGTVAADPRFLGAYFGDKMKVQINASGCKNLNEKKNLASVRFNSNNLDYMQSGTGFLTGFTVLGDPDMNFIYTEKKVDKELTAALWTGDVGVCTDAVDPLLDPAVCTGIKGAVQAWLVLQGCGWMNEAQGVLVNVTKGQVKLSKDTATAKTDFRVEGDYLNDDLKSKGWKFTIKSTNMDFVLD